MTIHPATVAVLSRYHCVYGFDTAQLSIRDKLLSLGFQSGRQESSRLGQSESVQLVQFVAGVVELDDYVCLCEVLILLFEHSDDLIGLLPLICAVN